MPVYNSNETTVTNQSVSAGGDSKVATYSLSSSTFWLNQQVPSLTSTFSPTQTTSTTLTPGTGQNYVSDVNISAYMRAVNIDLVAYNMRPNRKVYVFFDGKDVTKLIQKPNEVKIDNNSEFLGILPGYISDNQTNVSISGAIVGAVDTTQEEVEIAGGKARVLYTKEDTDGNKIVYLSEIISPNTVVDWANTDISIYSPRTGSTGNVVYTKAATGFIKKLIRNRDYDIYLNPIIFPEDSVGWYKLDVPFLKTDEDLVGKTITLVNGPKPGQSAQILEYISSNGAVRLGRDFEGFYTVANVVCSIDNVDTTINSGEKFDGGIFYDTGVPDISGNLYTDNNGVFAGTLRLPDPKLQPEYRFTSGEKLIRIIDSAVNNPEDATTIAEYIFVSYGLNLSTSQIIINNQGTQETVSVNVPDIGDPTTPTLPAIVTRGPAQNPVIKQDYSPLAQSFFVSAKESPYGIYVPYVDLFFANKGTLPIEVQIRPMVNGFPDSSKIIPNAVAYLEASKVKTTNSPDPTNPQSYTRFTFLSPVYLQADQEYAIVVKTNDFDYDIYIAELGQKQIGTERIVSEQPYTGVLFKSQNSSTYTPIQDEDLMFVLHKCQFASAGTVFFTEEKDLTYSKPITLRNVTSNSAFDSFKVQSDSVQMSGTLINYSYKATSNSTKTMDVAYTNFKPEIRVPLTERKVVYGPDILENSFEMRLDIATSSPDVSPIIYKNKQSISAIETLINDLSITPDRLIIANTGLGYTQQNTSITFTANVGFGANAVAGIASSPNSVGKIVTLTFDSNGYGYSDDVSVTVTSSDANASGAIIDVYKETGKTGGPALARYISKLVTLSPQFDAGDLRVYLTAVRPRQSNIDIYYKIRNRFDNESIADKNWVRMVKVPGTTDYSKELEPIEMEYRPSLSSNNITYSSNTATFDTFNQFKIKIVLSSSSTLLNEIPYVYDMRAIALPGDV